MKSPIREVFNCVYIHTNMFGILIVSVFGTLIYPKRAACMISARMFRYVWCCVPVGSNLYGLNWCWFQFGISNKIAGLGPSSCCCCSFSKKNHSNNMSHNPEKWNNSMYKSFFPHNLTCAWPIMYMLDWETWKGVTWMASSSILSFQS